MRDAPLKSERENARLIHALLALLLSIATVGGVFGCADYSISPFRSVPLVVPIHLDDDGRLDLAIAYRWVDGPPPHRTRIRLLWQNDTGGFDLAEELESGTNCASIAVGDLNGDGLTDIAVGNGGTREVVLLFRDPDAPDSLFETSTLPINGYPGGLAISDLNGDAHADLTVACTEGVSGIFFQDPLAPGTFTSFVGLGIAAGDVVVGDLDGLAGADLAFTHAPSGAVWVFLADSTFPGEFLGPTVFPSGPQPVDVQVGDFDGDGRQDLLVANFGDPGNASTSTSAILLQDPSLPGTFLPPLSLDTGPRTNAVAPAHLDGDGFLDFAAVRGGLISGGCDVFSCEFTDSVVSVLLQDISQSTNFLPPVLHPLHNDIGAFSLAAVDVNGDALTDLVVAAENTWLLLQDALDPGSFLPPSRIE